LKIKRYTLQARINNIKKQQNELKIKQLNNSLKIANDLNSSLLAAQPDIHQIIYTGMQNEGLSAKTTGFALTATGVGAEVGVPLATAGNWLSTRGTLYEMGYKINNSTLNKRGGVVIAIQFLNFYLTSGMANYVPKNPDQMAEILAQQVTNLVAGSMQKTIDNH